MRRIFVVLSVVLTLVGAFAAAGSVPGAAAQAGTPDAQPAGGAEQALLEVTVDRDQLPTDEGLIYIGRVTQEPGYRATCECQDERGTVITVVESGTFTFELERGGRIIRGANTDDPRKEPAPVATPFQLSAGDAMVFPGKKRVEANEGTEPAVYLFALILDTPVGPPAPDPSAVGVTTLETLGVVVGPWPDLGSGPVAIALRSTILDPGASLPSPAGGIQVVVPATVQDAATPTALAAGDDGATTNAGATPLAVLVLTIAPAGGAATPTT